MGRWGRILLATVAVAVGGLFAAFATAADSYPVLWFWTDRTTLGATTRMEFELSGLDAAGDTRGVVISVPPGYVLNSGRAAGDNRAWVTAKDGRVFTGSLTDMSPAAYAASTSAQACAPSPHAAAWALNVTSEGSEFSIPVAVDYSGGAYSLTFCFDDLHAQGIEVSDVDFVRDGGITTPRQVGQYLFHATVTPFAADGTPDATSAYELQADESLPRSLSIDATYSVAKKTLTVSGVGRSANGAINRRWVTVWTGSTPSKFTRAGYARTSVTGRYTFTKRLARAPRYADVELENAVGRGCVTLTAAPGGCLSASFGDTDSGYVRVAVR